MNQQCSCYKYATKKPTNLVGTCRSRGQAKGGQKELQRPGIEPGTSAVLRPRHNQLDHLCVVDRRGELCYIIFSQTQTITIIYDSYHSTALDACTNGYIRTSLERCYEQLHPSSLRE